MVAKTKQSIKTAVARQDDGTLQITITIPWEKIGQARQEAVKELASKIELPGFRKGKAPLPLVEKYLDREEVYNKTLQKLIPQAYSDAVEKHKLQPILTPRFQLVSAKEGQDWTIRAITTELPAIDIGDYKTKIQGATTATKIWTPGNKLDQKSSEKSQTPEEKQQSVIKAILANFDIKVPKLLVEEEVNHRLASLVDQTQKLGLTVEQYLASVGKNIEDIKQEYRKQAEEALKIDLVLTEIAKKEKIQITDREVESFLQAQGVKQEESKDAKQRKELIRSIMVRRKALDKLVALV